MCVAQSTPATRLPSEVGILMKVLVTGGAGFIGSHAVLALLEAGREVVVLDDLSNGSTEALRRVGKLAGRSAVFVRGDIRDRSLLANLFASNRFDAVMHFAGLKAVGESVRDPVRYFDVNVGGTVSLLSVMNSFGVDALVFSSSATVYGRPEVVPIPETCPVGSPANPYGRSKLMVEEVLRDMAQSDSRWRFAILRYFNPVGAHESGLIGEDPKGIPNNLLPYIAKVATGTMNRLSVFGGDYPTPDGTGVRDYIHVQDLVEGHLLALDRLASVSGTSVWNLGSGRGHSVLEIVRAFEEVSGREIPYEIMPRREGDIASSYSDSSKALRELGWRARRDLLSMMRDAWRWQQGNPDGYAGRREP